MAEFTELVATAISNIQARSEVEKLAEEQAALRRVAELVAREASQLDIFTAIAEEIGRLLGTDAMRMLRYESDGEAIVVASAGELDIFPVGSRWPLDGENVASRVHHTGQPARIDDYAAKSGSIAEGVRSVGIRSVVGTPVVVLGQVWGAMITATVTDEPLPPDTDTRLSQFTDLMATAIANGAAADRDAGGGRGASHGSVRRGGHGDGPSARCRRGHPQPLRGRRRRHCGRAQWVRPTSRTTRNPGQPSGRKRHLARTRLAAIRADGASSRGSGSNS
jgi:GAF domain-containing protein